MSGLFAKIPLLVGFLLWTFEECILMTADDSSTCWHWDINVSISLKEIAKGLETFCKFPKAFNASSGSL